MSYPDVYYVKNVGTGHYLTMTSATAQQPVLASATKDGKKSQWRIASAPNGGYKFKNEEYGLECFRGGSSVNVTSAADGFGFFIGGSETARKLTARQGGGTVVQEEGAGKVTSALDDGSKKQQWVFEVAQTTPTPGPGPGPTPGPDPNPGPTPDPDQYPRPPRADPYPVKSDYYVIKNVQSGTVFDLEKQIPGDNVKIFGFGFNNGPNQKWNIQPSGTAPTMTLLCVATNKHPTYQGLQEGGSLVSSGTTQEYLIYPADKGYYIGPVGKPGYICDLKDGSSKDETPIVLNINTGKDSQKWHLIPTSK